MTIFDVNPTDLIKEISKDLRQRYEKPAWTIWVKTGQHKERTPNNPDWWFERTASILYRVYKDGPLGTGSLREYYGGKKNRGVKPEKKRKSSGKIIRTCLQALEKDGMIKKAKSGRAITGKGEKFLTMISNKVKENASKKPVVDTASKVKKEEDDAAKKARESLRQQEQKEKQQEQKEKEKQPEKAHKEEKKQP